MADMDDSGGSELARFAAQARAIADLLDDVIDDLPDDAPAVVLERIEQAADLADALALGLEPVALDP